MSTVYILSTNGIESQRFTSKAKAITEAEMISKVAEERNVGDVITVTTQKTGKVVYTYTNEIDFSLPAPTIEIQGEYVEAEDAHGHIAEQTAWMTQEGVCVGLCAVGTGCMHCDEQYGEIEPETDAESLSEVIQRVETVCVIQNIPGTNGNMHYHTPGCRDIQREMKRHGQQKDDAFGGRFNSIADILAHEYGDVCNDDAYDMVCEANSEWFGVRVMPCLSISFGELNSRPLSFVHGMWVLGDAPETLVEDDQTSYEVPSHTRYPHGRKGPEDTTAETEVFEPGTRVISKVTGERGTVVQPYMTGVIYGIGERMSAVTLEMDNGSLQSALIGDLMLNFACKGEDGKAVHIAPCTEATGEDGACCALEDDGTDLDVTMIEMEFHLSVEVETGVTVDLGWHTFDVPATWNGDLIADLYGARHGSGNPKDGWSSIIQVIDFAAL